MHVSILEGVQNIQKYIFLTIWLIVLYSIDFENKFLIMASNLTTDQTFDSKWNHSESWRHWKQDIKVYLEAIKHTSEL